MAIDTENKRRSASNMILFTINPVPDGTIGSLDREITTGIYGGIAAVPLISAAARVTHIAAEILRDGTPDMRVTHVAAEILRAGTPTLRVTHVAIEILRSNISNARNSSFFLVL